MSQEPDRRRDIRSTRRRYLARAGTVLGAAGLGTGVLGSTTAHDTTEKELETKEPKERKEENGKEKNDGKDEKDGEKDEKEEGCLTHFAELTGEAEVPPVETDASGAAGFCVDECEKEVRFVLNVEHICNVTQAHIHLGEEGENGPIVVWLYPQDTQEPELIEGRFDGTLSEGTFTTEDFTEDFEGLDFEEFVELMDDEGLYVNVHTEQNPPGEIRGQITPDVPDKDERGGIGAGPRI